MTNWEEPSAYFGGHYNIMFPKNVYWSQSARSRGSRSPRRPGYGKVYHTGSAEDVQAMLDAEGGYWFHCASAHEGHDGLPGCDLRQAVDEERSLSGHGVQAGHGRRSVGSADVRVAVLRRDRHDEQPVRELRARPKYLIADIDTYRKGPEDDIYPGHPINYLKLDQMPGPDDDWTPIMKSLRNGDYFVTTGEILIKNYAVEGTGDKRTIAADLEWTFPLNFVEVVWGDGKTIDRQIIPANDLRRTARRSSRFRSMRRARCGSGWRCGIRRATARSCSPSG